MNLNGIDLDGLAHDADKIEFPPVVAGRTVHIDADFLAYQVTAERADGSDEKSFDDMKHNASIAIDTLLGLSAADRLHMHLTPSGSNKGKRFDLAILKEYQGNRVDKPKPKYLNIMREWLATEYTGTLHMNCEADDGMSSSQYAAIAAGKSNLSIIASKDKDLRMVPGLHLDWDTGAITDTSEFGHIEILERDGKPKKLVGLGQKYFWAQMLTGDTADNISGLPLVSGKVLNAIKPTQATIKAANDSADSTLSEAKRAKAAAVLAGRKAGLCGPVLAHDLLAPLTSNKQCFEAVKSLYRLYGEEFGFKHWKTGEDVHWGRVVASEGQLLWMRREAHNENCVLNFWRQVA